MATKKGTPFDPDGGAKGRQMRNVREVSDWYVRTRLASGASGLSEHITPEMIALKREAILLGRLRRQLNQTFKDLHHES